MALVLVAGTVPVVEAQAADAAVTAMSVIDDNGRSDRSVAAASFWRDGPDRIAVSRDAYSGEVKVQAYRGTSGYGDPGGISIAPAWEKSLEAGTYTDAPDDFPTADKPRFRLSGSQCQFGSARTTFTISDLAPDLSHFLLQYRTRCLSGGVGTFGEVRVNQSADAGVVLGARRLIWPERLVALSRSEIPLVLWNPGSDPLSITGVGLGGPDADQFLAEPLGACSQIQPGGSCQLTVGFRPTRAGDAQAVLTLDDPGGSHSMPLAGTAVMNPATLSIAGDWQNRIAYSPGNFWEGHDKVSVTQAEGSVSVRASRPGASSGTSIGFQPVRGERLHVGHYVASTALDAPPGPVITISEGSGGACQTQSGQFDVLDLAPDRVWITFIATCSSGEGPSVFGEVRSGEPVDGDVLTVPTRMPWSAQQVGETNDPVPITLVNLGEQGLPVSDVRATGTDAADFTVAPLGTCAVIASGDGCNVSVTFQPAELGPRSATLTVTDSRGGHTVDLTGSGRPGPQLATTPKPEYNHFPTCNVRMGATGPDSVAFSWGEECSSQSYFYDYAAHYLIRGALGTAAPQVEADGFAVYSGHGRSASIAHLQRGQTYTFTLFTQHNGGGEVKTYRTISPVLVSMNANLTSPVKGAQLLVTGSLSTANGTGIGTQPVELRAIYAGTTSAVTIATGQSDYSGNYEFRTVPTRPADYVVSYTGTGGYYFPGGSAARSVPLVARVVLQAPAKAVKYGQTVTIKATVAPVQANSPAQLQVYKNGKWKTLATARCATKGLLSFKVKLKDKGTYNYRVQWLGSAVTVAGPSKSVKIRVK
ncbi:MAG TPA: choice-of-anchor D domain-containing protein [Acidimicrobiales bacterium]|nr:choice-of-anchor D domain-containing protein [Acidimicrobiales bacterium]